MNTHQTDIATIFGILLDRIATLQVELVKSKETNKSLFAELNAMHAAERERENEEFVDMLRRELDSDLA